MQHASLYLNLFGPLPLGCYVSKILPTATITKPQTNHVALVLYSLVQFHMRKYSGCAET